MQNARIVTNPKSILILAGALAACMTGVATANTTILAGDMDNFGNTNNARVDTVVTRRAFGTWLSRSGAGGNNTAFHGGLSMPFDADQFSEGGSNGNSNWEFGYTFISLPMLTKDAELRIRVKGNNSDIPSNDAIELQYTGDGTNSSFLWGSSLATLNGSPWNSGSTATFTIKLGAGGANILNAINTRGYLDVYVEDDTAVDWIELNTVPTPGTASLLGLGGMVAMRRRRR